LKVICDSTVIIGLAKIGKLELLKQIYGEVYIPDAVFIEIAVVGRERNGAKEVAELEWIKRESVKDKRIIEILFAELGLGESEVLVLAKRLKLVPLIKPLIDELRSKSFRLSERLIEKVLKLAGE